MVFRQCIVAGVVLLVVTSVATCGAAISVSIAITPAVAPLGSPLEPVVTVVNDGDQPVSVPRGSMLRYALTLQVEGSGGATFEERAPFCGHAEWEDLAAAPAAAGLAHDKPFVQWSVARPTEGALLLGEPVVLVVSATWVNPEEGVTLASSPSLLSVRVHRADGTLAQLSGRGEIDLSLTSNELMPTIAWSAAEPTWTREVDVSSEYDVYRPDTYSISVSWSGADKDAEKMRAWIDRHSPHGDSADWRLFQKLMRDPDADVVPFIGAPFTRDLSVAVVCPTREDDRQVFRMLAGGECPSHAMSTRSLFQPHENWQTVLREHPSSRYAGYALSTGLLAPQYTQGMPGLRSATEVVASLANGGYFSSHPTVSVKTGSDSTDVDSYEAAQAHATMVSEFLAANPDFQYRDRLEFSLAYDMLALGEAANAADRWTWVVTNSKRADLCASARANLDVLRSLMAGAAP